MAKPPSKLPNSGDVLRQISAKQLSTFRRGTKVIEDPKLKQARKICRQKIDPSTFDPDADL